MTDKKTLILEREMLTYQEFNTQFSSYYGYGYDGAKKVKESMAEKRLNMIQQLKHSLLEAGGLSSQIIPINDGTFQQDVLLTEHQSTTLLNILKEQNQPFKQYIIFLKKILIFNYRYTRKKRSSLFFEQMPNQQWNISRPIPYYIDDSIGNNFFAHYLKISKIKILLFLQKNN